MPATSFFISAFLLAMASLPGRADVVGPKLPELIAVSKKLASGNTVVLIGIKDPGRGAVDYSSLGFDSSSDDLKSFAPKFMMTFGVDGFQKAYSFALGKKKDGMPKELLDAQKIRKQLLLGNKGKITLAVLTRFISNSEVGLFGKFFGVFGVNKGELRKNAEATKLLDIIQTKIASNEDIRIGLRQAPGDYPGLDTALDGDKLTQMNIALTARFNPQGLMALAAGSKDRPELAESLRLETRANAMRRSNLLTETANRNHLKIVRISERFAMLMLDCQNIPKDNEWDGQRLDIKGAPEQLAKRTNLADICSPEQRWAPLAVYGLERQKSAIQVIDFNNPNKLRDKALSEGIRQMAEAVLETTVPAAAPGVTIADLLYTDERRRHGSTVQLDSKPTSAELEIEGETDHLNPEVEGMILDPIRRNLEQIRDKGPSVSKVGTAAGVEEELNDPSFPRGVALSQALALIAQHQEGTRVLSGGDKAANALSARQTASARAFGSSISGGAFERFDGEMDAHAERSAENERKQRERDLKKDLKRAEKIKKAQQDPTPRYSCDANQKSQVVFMVDGLRPDRLKRAAEQDLIPNIKKSILSHSVQFDSYATTSISTAAWAAMMSGDREDQSGVIGASSSSRDPRDPDESWLDPRRNYKYYYVKAKKSGSQVYQAAHENGGDIIPDGVSRDRVYQSYFPGHDGVELPLKGLGRNAKEAVLQVTYGALNAPEILDAGAAEEARGDIEKNPCRYLSVRVYFPGIDDDSHRNPYALASEERNSFTILDKAVGRVMEAAKSDPVLKNATYFFVSDHGLSGGIEYADTDGSLHTGVTKPTMISNTSFNPVRFYAGDYPGVSENYGETVCSDMWPDEPTGGMISAPFRTVFKPYTFTHRGKNAGQKLKGSQKGCTINVESYGNDRGDMLLQNEPSAQVFTLRKDPTIRATFQELSASRTPTGKVVNRIDDVLNYQLDNTTVDWNPDARALMEARTGRHPVKFLAMGLQGDVARASADKLGGADAGPSQWDPTLILSRGENGQKKAGLILAKIGSDGKIRYRYIVIKNFNQKSTGEITGDISRDPSDDPLEIKGPGGKSLDPARWMSERQALAATENGPYPTGIVSPALIFNRTGSAHNEKYLARVPDYALYANQFFDFNTYEGQIADHGGPSKVESATTFIVSNPSCNGTVQAPGEPVLSRQLADTMDEMLTGRPGGKHQESLAGEVRGACGGALTDGTGENKQQGPAHNPVGEKTQQLEPDSAD